VPFAERPNLVIRIRHHSTPIARTAPDATVRRTMSTADVSRPTHALPSRRREIRASSVFAAGI
jgi:hypothetical protein